MHNAHQHTDAFYTNCVTLGCGIHTHTHTTIDNEILLFEILFAGNFHQVLRYIFEYCVEKKQVQEIAQCTSIHITVTENSKDAPRVHVICYATTTIAKR